MPQRSNAAEIENAEKSTESLRVKILPIERFQPHRVASSQDGNYNHAVTVVIAPCN